MYLSMKIIYKAEINEEIVGGLDLLRKSINEMIEQFGFDVSNSKIETPYEVDEE